MNTDLHQNLDRIEFVIEMVKRHVDTCRDSARLNDRDRSIFVFLGSEVSRAAHELWTSK